jgi:hypothetical protein
MRYGSTIPRPPSHRTLVASREMARFHRLPQGRNRSESGRLCKVELIERSVRAFGHTQPHDRLCWRMLPTVEPERGVKHLGSTASSEADAISMGNSNHVVNRTLKRGWFSTSSLAEVGRVAWRIEGR